MALVRRYLGRNQGGVLKALFIRPSVAAIKLRETNAEKCRFEHVSHLPRRCGRSN